VRIDEGKYTPIGSSWDVTFAHAVDHGEFTRRLTTLTDLTQVPDERLHTFAGTATYRTQFEVSNTEHAILDLGEVHDISEVTLNGTPLGTRWWGRHRYDAGQALRPGRNTLEVEVSTTLFNYCYSLKENATATRWTKGRKPVPTGLVGPVRLYEGE